MREVKGDLFSFPADVKCITTNGFVKKNGECVMGRGCAKEARDKFPGIASLLGTYIRLHGNHVHDLGVHDNTHILSFPVKHRWNEQADPQLIAQSAAELDAWVNVNFDYKDAVILIPRPGCGNGGLKWDDVRPILEPILDDRFIIIDFLR